MRSTTRWSRRVSLWSGYPTVFLFYYYVPHLLFEIAILLWLNWGFPVANVCLLLPEDKEKHQATRDPSIQSIASWWRKFWGFYHQESHGDLRKFMGRNPPDFLELTPGHCLCGLVDPSQKSSESTGNVQLYLPFLGLNSKYWTPIMGDEPNLIVCSAKFWDSNTRVWLTEMCIFTQKMRNSPIMSGNLQPVDAGWQFGTFVVLHFWGVKRTTFKV